MGKGQNHAPAEWGYWRLGRIKGFAVGSVEKTATQSETTLKLAHQKPLPICSGS